MSPTSRDSGQSCSLPEGARQPVDQSGRYLLRSVVKHSRARPPRAGNREAPQGKTPLGGIRQEKQLLLIPARFAIEMQSRGWILRNDVIWHKPNAVPRPEGDRLRNTHEHFFHFVKKPKQGRAKYHYELEHAEPRGNDVVVVNVAPGEGGHSATFPFDLIEPRIRTHRRPEARCWTRSAARGARSMSRRPWGAMSSASTHKASLWKFLRARLMAESSPGNFVSEWFGRRIDPTVRISPPDFEQSSKPSSRQQK